MYKFVTAHCLSRTIGSQWSEVDISKSLVSTIFNVFRKVYMVVHDSYIDKNVYVDIDEFRVSYSGRTITIQEMLDFHAGLPLVTVETLPSSNLKYAKYSIGNKVGYKYDFVKAGYNYDYDSASEILTDLRLKRPGYSTDMSLLHTHCLITVNGFIHETDTDGTYTYVLNGAKSMRIAKDNRFGILSFLDIGELTKFKLNKDNIFPSRVDGPMSEKITFKVGEDIGENCFFLVLGGYMVLPEEGIFWRTGNDSFTLDINRLPYLSRIMESRDFIDISGLDLKVPSVNSLAIDAAEPFTDDVLKNYLTMNNSFFVKVGTKDITFGKYGLKRYNTPGSFFLPHSPDAPMFVSHGRMVEYWSQKQGERYHVSVPDSYYRNYALEYRQVTEAQHIDKSFMAGRPVGHSGAMMLEISSYVE